MGVTIPSLRKIVLTGKTYASKARDFIHITLNQVPTAVFAAQPNDNDIN